ncbi:EscT/YscT/HrcT family type III secretion system export apparatus protein [Paraburkholderia sp. NMBU_R16]|uniref:type III secretion system export apparatus subunit SctT n=1 Tax=Paraburkholderia sp. NMBU_R16 TaxID=2698676 RepID=UPI0015663C3A|nr:type III secretion system export apparatus subunit SctT [Paraburkholderia sp. NMBU_R16]NRO98984.1 EscT/YscT/HrcT family type III secretion system export apparatus protein [Paraburkholderia sp. NMBU_R16]
MSDFTLSLLTLSHKFESLAALVALCSARLMVLMMVFPPTGDTVLQGAVRTALSLLWGCVVAYGQQGIFVEQSALMQVAIGLKEAVIGLVLGFSASTVFWAAQSIGGYVDDLSGYNSVQLNDPVHGQETSLTSTLLSLFAIGAFWTLGGMTFLLGALYDSYRWWPLGDMLPVGDRILESFVLQKTDSLIETIAKLAAPMTVLLLLVDIGFGFTGKASQKIDLQSMSQPVKGALTVLMLALLASVFVDQARDQLSLAGFAREIHAFASGK